MLQEGCTCAAAGGTWKKQGSKSVVHSKNLQKLLKVTLQHEGTLVSPPPEYFGVHAHESPSGHPNWHEKGAGAAGGRERSEVYGRVVLQNASSQPKPGQDRALKQRVIETQTSHHDHVRKNWVTLPSTASENEEHYRRGCRPPCKFPLVRFDRDDLRHKVLVENSKWTVTERNLQVTITRSDTVNLPPLDERNVWELANRQVTKQSPKLPVSIYLDAG